MGFGNPQKLMKQVQKMQADMARLQEQLGEMTVESTAGGGAIRCVMNCKQEIKELEIDPELLNPEDVEMLQDMLILAVNSATRLAQEKSSDEMSKITGGLKVPGLY
ncbi:MAG: YbaB/EbfC family nucleoid-associated protein [Peptococcaceae bacterium]|nr:YbaB/EbfC family nucleoid-associated protein [Peptococcaceae bacterium]